MRRFRPGPPGEPRTVWWGGHVFTPDELRRTFSTPSVLDSVRAAKRREGLVHYSTSQTPSFRAPSPESIARHAGGSAVVLVDAANKRLHRLSRMKTGTLTAARLVEDTIRRGGFRTCAYFVTLTYAPGQVWNPRHVSGFIDTTRKWLKRACPWAKLRYVWTAELQDRGAVHYHLIFWLPRHLQFPKPDARGWWKHGSTNRQRVKKNSVGYIASYLSKGDDPDGPQFPKGCRICGAGGFDAEARREARYWKAPKDCRAALGPAADIRRVTGGRVDTRTGEFWRCEWRMVKVNGAPTLIKFKHQPREAQLCPF